MTDQRTLELEPRSTEIAVADISGWRIGMSVELGRHDGPVQGSFIVTGITTRPGPHRGFGRVRLRRRQPG